MSLTCFNEDGIELVIDTVTGEVFVTQRGYARMSGKAASTITKKCRSKSLKSAKITTNGGYQNVMLIPLDIIFVWLKEDENYNVLAKIINLLMRKNIAVPSIVTERPKPTSKKGVRGYIYMFGTVCSEEAIFKNGCDFVKIGFSQNPIKRFKTINEVVPTPMVIVDILKNCYLIEELKFHQENNLHRIKGEWYSWAIKHEYKEFFKDKISVIEDAKYSPYRTYKIDSDNEESLCDAFGIYW